MNKELRAKLHPYELGWHVYKNPVFVWAAITIIENQKQGLIYPDWIRLYLLNAADALTKDIGDATKLGSPDIVIKNNLGFNTLGQGNAFTQFQTQLRSVMSFIAIAHKKPNMTNEAALAILSEICGIDARQLEKLRENLISRVRDNIS